MTSLHKMLSTGAAALLACATVLAQSPPAAPAPAVATTLPDYQGPAVEQFLLKGKITKVADIPVGVTGPHKVTLDYNGATHFAAFKSIDQEQAGFTDFESGPTSGEGNFQDSWKMEIAAYQVDMIIGLHKVPASVERYVKNEQGALTWWVDSMMEEGDRLKRNITPPNPELWNRETEKMWLFDNLIYNTDPNTGNILIANDWTLRLIDHSRAFRAFNQLRTPKDLTRFSRSLLDGLKNLQQADLQKKIGKYVSSYQIKGLLARRDLILKLAQDAVAQKGEAAVLYP